MSDSLLDRVIEELAQLARQSRVKRPVLFYLNPDARPAQFVYEAICGRPLERRTGPAGHALVTKVTCTVKGAAAALREHAGLGGGLVADLLKTPPLRADAWWVVVSTDDVWAAAFYRGKVVGRSHESIR